MSTYSSILRTELIGAGEQPGTWGSTTNSNFQYIFESAIAGYQAVTVSPSSNNQVLTYVNGPSAAPALNQSIYAMLKLNAGTLGAAFNIYAPPVSKTYIIWNNTSYTATFYNSTVIGNTTAAGSGAVIPAGARVMVWSDGTSFYGNNAIIGNLTVNGNLEVTGATTLTGVATFTAQPIMSTLTASLAVFTDGSKGLVSKALNGTGNVVLTDSPTFTGVPAAPTAAAGTNTTQIATTAFVLANGVPTGGLVMWPTDTAPNGFLLCDGTAVSRTTYAALFAIVGTTFGSGNGSTTFNLPNYEDRMPYGTTVGATGGSANATLVSHSHSFTGNALGDHSHTTTFNQTSKSNNATPYMLSNPYIGENQNGSVALPTTSASAGTPTGSISTEGSSATNANLPPYLGINFIIKT